jgi:hypothetical protein
MPAMAILLLYCYFSGFLMARTRSCGGCGCTTILPRRFLMRVV